MSDSTPNTAAVEAANLLLPEVTHDHLAEALENTVSASDVTSPAEPSTVSESKPRRLIGKLLHGDHPNVHSKTKPASKSSFLAKLIPGIEKLEAADHLGNFVVQRDTGEKKFEEMPIYVRIGMHLLFVSGSPVGLTNYKSIEHLMQAQSIKQGKIFDSPEGAAEHIQDFVETYHLQDSLQELLYPDLKDYKTFNEFFYRRLKPDARPVDGSMDNTIATSPADCRLTVFQDIDTAKKFWIKGKQFSLENLFGDHSISSHPAFVNGASLAISRLAPQDFHRFHAPLTAQLGPLRHIPGELYTVNPQAVNANINVFTANKRDVLLMHLPPRNDGEEPIPVVFVAVGAMLVGSIGWSKESGSMVTQGEELGWFAYGGSTVITVFPKDSIIFDKDLLENSLNQLETQIKIGQSIGKMN